MYPQDKIWEKMIKEHSIAGHPVRYFQEVGSTNDIARKSAFTGAEKGTVIIADYQKKGRGRLGRSWISPPGSGLYFSLILSPALAPADLPKITLAAGVALCRAAKSYLSNPVLKWPNDFLLKGKKAAGILTETFFLQESGYLVILGMGINVNTPRHDFPPDIAGKITNIQETCGKPLARGELLEIILNQMDNLLAQAEQFGFSDILKEWRSYDAGRGKYLTWLTTEGGVIRGVSQGIDDNGLLWIRDEQGKLHEVVSGDIRYPI
ncbi:MAG: biotin--[acetyl-CoA-carboxylase] ligase [Thermodesulfobacteriota bacterium]